MQFLLAVLEVSTVSALSVVLVVTIEVSVSAGYAVIEFQPFRGTRGGAVVYIRSHLSNQAQFKNRTNKNSSSVLRRGITQTKGSNTQD